MSEHVGYQLVASNGAVIEMWGGTYGQCPRIPQMVILPLRDKQSVPDQVHSPQLDADLGGGTRLVKWYVDTLSPCAEAREHLLLPYQFWAMVTVAGLQPAIDDLIEAIEDPITRVVTQSKFNHYTSFALDDPLIQAIKEHSGLTDELLAGYWLQASAF